MGHCYPHLSLEERRKIAKWREAKMPIPEIADRLGRAPSTIYRELKRNHFGDKELPELNGYYALSAQTMYEQRRAIHRKMIAHPELKAAIDMPPDTAVRSGGPQAGRLRQIDRHGSGTSHAAARRWCVGDMPNSARYARLMALAFS